MKRDTFSFSVYLRTSKTDQDGKAPLYGRVTVNKKRAEFSLKQRISPKDWDDKKGIVKGRKPQTKLIQKVIETLRFRSNEVYRDLLNDGKEPDPFVIKQKIFGGVRDQKGIVGYYLEHNDDLKEKIGIGISKNTVKRHQTSVGHLKQFIKERFGRNDVYLRELDPQFIEDYYWFFRKDRECNHNTSLKYLRNLHKVTTKALKRGLIKLDPYREMNFKFDKVEKPFLTKEELQQIVELEIFNERIRQVRDIFVFCCFTGLAYGDVHDLRPEHIIKGIDGGEWIKKARHKTGVISTIPLLPIPAKILKKYEDHPNRAIKGTLLPVNSNQKMNAYLKEIANLCDIDKELTTHIARHTFATTVTLSNHVSMEAVSKMLGHASTRLTKEYAKIVDEYLNEEIKKLKGKFE